MAGRPKKTIDYDLVGKLAMIQCTEEEIAGILDISTRTLQKDKEFIRIFHTKKDAGKSSLRRMQWKTAEAGNPTMQIWLGKQYLGQRDMPKEAENTEALDKLVSAIERNVQPEAETGAGGS